MTGQCKFYRNLFCFFRLPTKEEGNPAHIAHITKAPQAYADTKALAKSASLPTLLNNWFISKVVFRSIKDNNLVTLQITNIDTYLSKR